jgi:hypothetical protein
MVVAMPVAPVEIMGRRFTRADLDGLPVDGPRYEQFEPAVPFPVRVAPAGPVRRPPVA